MQFLELMKSNSEITINNSAYLEEKERDLKDNTICKMKLETTWMKAQHKNLMLCWMSLGKALEDNQECQLTHSLSGSNFH